MNASNSDGKADTIAPRARVAAAALVEEGATPLNPSDRAFWFGLGVVLLSLFRPRQLSHSDWADRDRAAQRIRLDGTDYQRRPHPCDAEHHRMASARIAPRMERQSAGSATAYAHRRPLHSHRRASRRAARRCRDDDVLAFARRMVLPVEPAPSWKTPTTSRRPTSTSTTRSSEPTSSTWSATSMARSRLSRTIRTHFRNSLSAKPAFAI